MAELSQHTVRGWEVLRLSTEELSLDLVPALGGTVISLVRRADGAELLWSTPWGLRARGAQLLPGTAEAQASDTSAGGWQTLFPNGGDSAAVHGVEWGYDGEARLTWMDWTFTGSSLLLNGRLARSPFELSKTVSLRRTEVTIGETVRNVGVEAVDTMWGSQVTLGGSLIGSDTVVEAAATVVRPDPQTSPSTSYDDLMPWPRAYGAETVINLATIPALDAAETRLAYLGDFTAPTMRVRRPSVGLDLELEWDGETWPHVWYRMEAGGRRTHPWYGRGYFLALTPATSWPAHGLYDARRVSGSTLSIEPDTARTAHLTLRLR